MSLYKFSVMQSAALAAVLSAVAGSASAVDLNGGGATLPAPYARVASDCWGNKEDLYARIASGAQLDAVELADFDYSNTVSGALRTFNCATQQISSNDKVRYISTGSGRGIEGYISHDPSRFLSGALYPPGVPAYTGGTKFALSEAALSTAQISAWTNGGTDVQGSVDLRAPGIADDPANANDYANPQATYGSIIQIPALIAPVAIAFDPYYRTLGRSNGTVSRYRFNIQNGYLSLDRETMCKIFNGNITDWTDPTLTAINGGVALKATNDPTPGGIPLRIVGRDENSGTTSLWTRHLAKVCGDLKTAGLITVNYYNNAAQNLGNAAGDVNVTLRQQASVTNDEYYVGNEGVSAALATDTAATGQTITNGRIGYLSPDYLPQYAPAGSDPASYTLTTVKVQNASGNFILINPANATKSFIGILPPQSNADGSYNASAPGDRANPADWVGKPDKSDPLADPSAEVGYPIVGTSNFLLYSCYNTSASKVALTYPGNATTPEGFLHWWYNKKTYMMSDLSKGLAARSGFAPVPASFALAINYTFVADKINRDLSIERRGGPGCTAAGLVGS